MLQTANRKQQTINCGLAASPNRKQKTVNRQPPAASRRGFTLVELLLATTLLSVLMLFVFNFIDQASRAWSVSEKKIDAFREVRAALYFLKRDLQGMVATDAIPWFLFDDPAAGSSQLPAANAINGEAANTPAAHGDFLFFITSLPVEAQASGSLSDLCAVGYYLSYWKDVGSYGGYSTADFGYAPTYKLHRYFKSSNDTWRAGNGSSSNTGLFPFLQTSGTSALFDSPQGIANGGDEVIARNVVNFRVIPIYEDTSGATVRLWTPGDGTDTYDSTLPGPGGKRARNVRPSAIEIVLTAYNQETARQIGDNRNAWDRASDLPASGPGADPAQQLRNREAQLFRTRVSLK